MAEHLVEALVEPFEPEKYTDDYRHDIMALIERKVAAGEVNTLPDAPTKKASSPRPKSIDLAALLAQSVEGLGTARPANENSRSVRKAHPRGEKAEGTSSNAAKNATSKSKNANKSDAPRSTRRTNTHARDKKSA